MTPRDDRPLVALTLGDVAGVGPEVIARAWGDTPLRTLARPFVVGSRSVLERALACVGGQAAVQEIARPEEARPTARLIPCLEATDVDLADRAIRPLTGGRAPRVAVAALNPHGGESGLFGDEERRIIEPAIARAREAGIDANGPIACDTLFVRAIAGEFDVVVAMYHDQGPVA